MKICMIAYVLVDRRNLSVKLRLAVKVGHSVGINSIVANWNELSARIKDEFQVMKMLVFARKIRHVRLARARRAG